jgi:hypothetical protein
VKKHIQQIAGSVLFLASLAVSPAWSNPSEVYLPEATIKHELHKRAPLPDISVQYFEQLRGLRRPFNQSHARLGGSARGGSLFPAPAPSSMSLSLGEPQAELSILLPSTTGRADLEKLVKATKQMAELAVLHHTLTQVHSGEVEMESESLLDYWKEVQQITMPDPFFLEANRSALMSLFLDRYQAFAHKTFEQYAEQHGIHNQERGWFLGAIRAIDPRLGMWQQIWESAPGSLQDRSSLKAGCFRAFLKAQEEVTEQMANRYLSVYLAQDSVQDFDSVFPVLDKSLRAAPHQQVLLSWLIDRATTPKYLGKLLEMELWDAAFLRFAGEITNEQADPTEMPTRQNSEATGWSFPEELLFGEVFLKLLDRAQSTLGISPADFLANVFDRLLGAKRPRFLNFLLETYLFHIEKLLEKGQLPPGTYSAMEAHLKAISKELFARSPEPLANEVRWCRSLGQYALMLLQETTVLSRGWYPPTAESMAEIFKLSTASDTEPFLRLAARSALASFVPTMLDRTMEALQGELPESQDSVDFVTTMGSCIGLLAQAADQAKKFKN